VPLFDPGLLSESGEIHWLLDLRWGGQTYRLSERAVLVTYQGAALQYHGGLEFDGALEQRLDLYTDTPAQRSVSLTAHLQSLVDVPARIAAGHSLGLATAELALWLDGDAERHVTLMDGRLRSVNHGSADEPVSFILEEAPLLAPGRIPSELQRLQSPASYVTSLPQIRGQYHPVIFGRPTNSPALYNNLFVGFTSTLVLAGHPCVEGSVTISDPAAGTSQASTAEYRADGAFTGPAIRSTVADVATTFPATADDAKNAHYTTWGTAAGVPSRRDPTVPMREAGEILLWLLARSGVARVDYGRMEVEAQKLSGYLLDAAIVPGDKERVSPIDWIQQHLLPILPITACTSRSGLYYLAWPVEPSASSAVDHIDVGRLDCARMGDVEYSETSELVQQVSLSYGFDYADNSYASRLIYTADPDLLGTDTTIVPSRPLDWSYRIAASSRRDWIRPMEVSTEVVQDLSTAHQVCRSLAWRHGIPSRLLSYVGGRRLAHLERGSVVLLSDPELSLTEAVAVVEGVTYSSSNSIGLSLRLPDRIDPGA
jgi:hypothetical protein